jgi:flagellar hook assembly protein FlgD
VRLDIFDVAGRLVRQLVGGELPPGDHEAAWDGRDGRGARLASGIYLVRLEALDQIRSQRVALVDR